jgi:hypothetical protein
MDTVSSGEHKSLSSFGTLLKRLHVQQEGRTFLHSAIPAKPISPNEQTRVSCTITRSLIGPPIALVCSTAVFRVSSVSQGEL